MSPNRRVNYIVALSVSWRQEGVQCYGEPAMYEIIHFDISITLHVHMKHREELKQMTIVVELFGEIVRFVVCCLSRLWTTSDTVPHGLSTLSDHLWRCRLYACRSKTVLGSTPDK